MLIQIKNLSFIYPEALYPVFENINLTLDTSWRLGLLGRNGRGKTTLLRLLLGQLHGKGTIDSPEKFEYFPQWPQNKDISSIQAARAAIAPYDEWEDKMNLLLQLQTKEALDEYGEIEEAYAAQDGYIINELIAAEAVKLGISGEALQRPFKELSGGEQIKLLLAASFLKKHHFMLIDEPTDHLDAEGRDVVANWLAGKSGFIVISHDRAFVDKAVNHVLVINKSGIELQKGNYSSWRENRTRQDEFEKSQNLKIEKEVSRLQKAARRTALWSDTVEKSKLNTANAASNKGAAMIDKGYIGARAASMMKQSKSIENRQQKEIDAKKSLLKNIEEQDPLHFQILTPAKKTILTVEKLTMKYEEKTLFSNLSFTIETAERIAVCGGNGSGKSTLLKLIRGLLQPTSGNILVSAATVISSVPQISSLLTGNIKDFAAKKQVDEVLFLAILRKFGFSRELFTQDMQRYSAGEQKKVYLAASLAKPAHLFVWDEPLNYIDIISREQIEQAILLSAPTMLFVEHDKTFTSNVATKQINLDLL